MGSFQESLWAQRNGWRQWYGKNVFTTFLLSLGIQVLSTMTLKVPEKVTISQVPSTSLLPSPGLHPFHLVLHPVLNYFQRLFPGPWWPVGKWSPHSCYLISSHCWLTHYWSVNGILSWGFLCSSTCCINHPVTLLIFLHFLSSDFSQQPCFSFHKSPPTRIAIRLHQQACHGDCLPNNSWMLQTLLNSIFHYEHFWPRERRLLSSPSIYYFERFFSIICGLLRVLLISLISSLTNISILRE